MSDRIAIAAGMAVQGSPDLFRRMKSLNKVRLRWGWGLAGLVLGLAPRPDLPWFMAGLLLIALGLCIRVLAAATLTKIEALTTHGIYRLTRNPLYLGNFLAGCGIACLGGHWGWLAACLILFGLIYRRLILAEEAFLLQEYGSEYQAYMTTVPRWWPDFRQWRAIPGTLSWAEFARNKEPRNLLATAAFLLLILVKMWLLPPGISWWGATIAL